MHGVRWLLRGLRPPWQAADRGATMIEWALVVSLVAVFAIGAVSMVGQGVAARILEYANL